MKSSSISFVLVAALCVAGAFRFGKTHSKPQAQELPAFDSVQAAKVVNLPAVKGQASVLLSTVHVISERRASELGTADKPSRRPVTIIGASTIKRCESHDLVNNHVHSTNTSFTKGGSVTICR